MVTVAIIVLIATSIMGLTPRLRAWQARQAEQRAAQQRAVLDEMLMDIERVKQARDTLHHLHKETSP
jgi:type II secretory pathway pseudopilin PulG